jgi:hypothetical protein
MRWMRRGVIFIASGACLALPGNALAVQLLAPPGHPGVSEYVEVIPTGAGNAAPPGSVRGSGSASAGPQALAQLGRGRATDAKLAKLGKTGAAAAALAASTAPPSLTGAAKAEVKSVAAGASKPGSSGSVGSGISHALVSSDTGGLGLLLPLLLGTVLVMALAFGLIQLRRRTHPT